jgi:hypothetical protein
MLSSRIHEEIDVVWQALEAAGGDVVDVSNTIDTAYIFVSGLSAIECERIVKNVAMVEEYTAYDEDGMVVVGIKV